MQRSGKARTRPSTDGLSAAVCLHAQLEERKDELWASQHAKATLERKLVACHVSLSDADVRSVALEAAAPVMAARLIGHSADLFLAVFTPAGPAAGRDAVKQVCVLALHRSADERLHTFKCDWPVSVFSSGASSIT